VPKIKKRKNVFYIYGFTDWRFALCGLFFLYQYNSINYVINSTLRKFFNTTSQETVDVCLEMFGCLQAERTIAIRKRKFFNKFSIIHNALYRVFVVTAKAKLESCCTEV